MERENLRVLVYETDDAAYEKLSATLKSGHGREGVTVERASSAAHLDKLLWARVPPIKVDGLIIGGPDGDITEWLPAMNQQGYRLGRSMPVYFHCAGDRLEMVEEFRAHGNFDRGLQGEAYVKQFAQLFASLPRAA